MTDEQWAALEPLVEACWPKGKAPPRDLRRTIGAIVWRHANGARWRAIPTRSNEAAVACPAWVNNNRNLVKRLWARLKEWRAVATRYEKTAASYLGVLCLATTADWLKP